MQGLLETALANPWATLERVLDGPLHPGGDESTAALLDRAGVTADTRLIDLGCGAGNGLELARDRGANAVGLDRDPPAGGVRGDLSSLPLRECSVDVALSECVMCLVPDRSEAVEEVSRVLVEGGRFALSDVVVEGDLPDLPDPIVRTLCLSSATGREDLVAAVEDGGFAVEEVCDHREDLLAMRDDVRDRVDYESILGLLGEEGQRLLDGIEAAETAVERGDIGYVSLVGTKE